MTILVDMNLSPMWVPFLAQHGIDAVHWSTIGKATAPDYEILDYAGIRKFVVFTNDLDFGTLLAKRRIRGPSVIQLRTQDLLPDSVGTIVLGTIASCRSELESGCIIAVDPRRQRIRLLPIE